jgi:hypothetical protein
MHIDCDGCVMRDIACADCVVTFLLGPPQAGLDAAEHAALAVLAGGGLVPPLRMRPRPAAEEVPGSPAPARDAASA